MFGTKNMDALLIFEVLMYINLYYYPISGTCNAIMTFAKYQSIINTPKIERDATVQGAVLASELIRLILYQLLQENKKGFAVALAVVLALVYIAGLYYIFFIQQPVLKLEVILDSIMSVLLIGEVFYGMLSFLPCCKKQDFS